MNVHQQQWKQMQLALAQQRLPQSLLFVGPLHCALDDFTVKVAQLLICKANQETPCLSCVDCQMTKQIEHPDVEWVKPDKIGGPIKIDQIRELQHSAYLTPQRSNFRVIIIESADRMNTAAANALLKILEEPPKHTLFILIAQQLGTVTPTVLSRCQIIHFSISEDKSYNNLLLLGSLYPQDSDRVSIVNQSETILDRLIALIECKEHPCVLAAQWVQYDQNTLFWFLYLVYSQLQHMYVTKSDVKGPGALQLKRLCNLLDPIIIFTQIDKLNTVLKKLSHNITINYALALEDLLFSLLPGIK